ncbi:Hypothetical predicted protein [Octopus vulgaris]|uniref:Uncharacterized protein n=1 Tax=Octopus vulgaris TaxID=6645 RepID=A0AA36F528_OCTVU|nr:Hypothetical predicted protein [Octopus vulgaris]
MDRIHKRKRNQLWINEYGNRMDERLSVVAVEVGVGGSGGGGGGGGGDGGISGIGCGTTAIVLNEGVLVTVG